MVDDVTDYGFLTAKFHIDHGQEGRTLHGTEEPGPATGQDGDCYLWRLEVAGVRSAFFYPRKQNGKWGNSVRLSPDAPMRGVYESTIAAYPEYAAVPPSTDSAEKL